MAFISEFNSLMWGYVLSIILSILIGAVMLAVNVVYFGKRKHMFS